MRQFLLFVACFLLVNLLANAQQTNLNLDFADGAVRFVPIHSDGSKPSFTLSVANGALKINTTKRKEDWSFLGLFGQNIDLSALQTLQFKLKADQTGDFIVRIKSDKKSNAAEMTQIEVVTKMVASTDFSNYFYDLSSLVLANADLDIKKIKEIQIDVSKGWTEPLTAVVELDDFKLGFAEPLPEGGSSFSEDFNSGTLPASIKPNSRYSLSAVDQALKASINRNANRWAFFDVEMGAVYNFANNPYVSLKVKTDKDFVMQLFLVDENGKGYAIEQTGGQYKYDELLANQFHYEQTRFYKGTEYVDAFFDFSKAKSSVVDLSKITAIRIVANGTALTFNGTFYIDEITAGADVVKKAYIAQIPTHTFPQVSLTPKTIIIPEIQNAESIVVSGGENLISNTSVSAINYKTVNEFHKTLTYGYAFFTFDIIPGAAGSAKITLTAKGAAGYTDNSTSFILNVAENKKPTIDTLTDIEAIVGQQTQKSIEGLTSGNPEADQKLTITATSDNLAVVDVVEIVYPQGSSKGILKFSPIGAGETTIRVIVSDDGGASEETQFNVSAYPSLNGKPTVNAQSKIDLYTISDALEVILTGIDDGDGMSQILTLTATSSNTDVVKQPVVTYNQGASSAQLAIEPTGTQTGKAKITITVTDNGGNETNNGNQSVTTEFEVEVNQKPATGFGIDFSQPEVLSAFGPEGNGVNFFLTVVDTLGSKALRIRMKDKWTYGGIFVTLPQELNLSAKPIVSYEIFSLDKASWHWNYFYDAHGRDGSLNRNLQNSDQHQFKADANVWKTISFDYSSPGDLNNGIGEPIDASRIDGLLINMHDNKPSWPFTDASGVLYIRNIKFGDQAEAEKIDYKCTLNAIGDQAYFENDGKKTLLLSGISNGKGSTEGIKASVSVTNTTILGNAAIGTVNADGTTTLTFDALASGTTYFKIKIEAEGSSTLEFTCKVSVLKADAETSEINYDLNDEKQTIRGLGTFHFDPRFADLYTNELGASAVRIGIIGNEWEPVNDNNDPNVLNMGGFDYKAFDWDYFRKLKAQGVETFLLTSWSPPAWMKRNLSLDHREQALEWEKTDNILEPYYYDEFAESMAAVVKAFKEKCDIDLLAIGLQNEPYFNEPYPSAIINGTQFAKLITITADKFKKYGLEKVGFYMPEQVFGIGWGDYSNEGYLNALSANSEADALCSYFAVHGYDGSGITAGFPDYSNWEKLWNQASGGTNPKEIWMTETHVGYIDWTSAMNVAGAIHGSLWAGNISLWTNWGFEDMQLTKNEPNSTFYTSKSYFKYIRPGAVRVETSSDNPDLMPTAFLNKDGKFVMVIINKGTKAYPLDLVGGNLPNSFEAYRTSRSEDFVAIGTLKPNEKPFILPANSVITLVAEELNELSIDNIEDIELPEGAIHEIEITGIATKNGSLSDLELTFSNSNDGLFSNFNLSEITSNGTATLSFTGKDAQKGFAVVKVTLQDKSGNSVSTNFTITLGTTGIGLFNNTQGNVKIINKTDLGFLKIEQTNDKFSAFRVFDVNGRTLKSGNISGDRFEVDTHNLRKGVYLINLSGQKQNKTFRFSVK
jgi:O-glycosyl hydrolase